MQRTPRGYSINAPDPPRLTSGWPRLFSNTTLPLLPLFLHLHCQIKANRFAPREKKTAKCCLINPQPSRYARAAGQYDVLKTKSRSNQVLKAPYLEVRCHLFRVSRFLSVNYRVDLNISHYSLGDAVSSLHQCRQNRS